jgi:Glycosyl hydrolase family 9/Cellulase N-terminal ig-like domain
MRFRTLLMAVCVILPAADAPPRMPIPNDYHGSILTRWLNKPVEQSKILDSAETLDRWRLVNADQATGEMTLTSERKVEGNTSLRLRCPTVGTNPPPGRYYGTASARLLGNDEDWSEWNRLSFWVYADLPDFRVVSMIVTFRNEGKERVPDSYNKMGVNYVILKNHEWNHVVWEIANLPREKVAAVDFSYRMQGHEPGAAEIATLDFDKVELQKVNADHFEGWDVAPGEISFSHSGYQSGSPKSAIASDLKASDFDLIDTQTQKAVLTRKVSAIDSQIGHFQVMDFSEVRKPGTYLVRAGGRSTRPFRIGDDIWQPSLWKAINFFYVERCGYAISGVHDICHRDWVVKHGDKQIVVNGGWHDAGDLSQSLSNTAEAAYSMFSLADRMQRNGEDPQLLNRLLEEARWGLDWLLKVTFHDGFRPNFSQMDRWTDGILGNLDDAGAQASNNAASNLAAAATEAIAARVLKTSDPILAAHSLKQAQEDWGFAMTSISGTGGGRGNPAETAGHAVIAGLELWQATGDRAYADKAIELSKIITGSQQRSFIAGMTTPLTGYFYTGPDKNRILRYQHLSHEEAPTVALVHLCELFPEDPNWMQWYSAVTLYTEYFQKPMANFTEPYGMLANSLFRDDEYLAQPERGGNGATRDAFREQVLNGVKVGDHYYVRLFPVWFEFRGNNGTMLAENKAIAEAAHLRGNLNLANLAERNLEWVVGRNPFVQSQMWGEGYDYAPQYSAMSGDIVGSLPVGIQAHRNADAPYWPAENCHNWKEVWVHPVGRWIWLMKDLAGPARVDGASKAPVQFRELSTSRTTRVTPDAASGKFLALLPHGEYEITVGVRKQFLTLLPGEAYSADLGSDNYVDFAVSRESNAPGFISIRAGVSGSGDHTLSIRTDNLVVEQTSRHVTLRPGTPQTIEWKAKVASPDSPWVAVVIPDNRMSQRKELTGR